MSTLTAFQTALKDFFAASSAPATWPPDGTKTLAEWLALQNASLLFQVVNDPVFGGGLELTIPQSSVTSGVARTAIAASSEYGTISPDALKKIEFPLGSDPIDLGNAALVASIESVILLYTGGDPNSDMLAHFRALKTKAASIAQYVAAGLGMPDPRNVSATMEDINAIIQQ